MRPTFLLLAFASVVATAACHKDSTSPGDGGGGGGGGPTPIVYTLYVDTLLPDTVTTTVATAVPVRAVLTKEGLPVPNAKVAWKTNTGTVSSDTTFTNADGVASVSWTIANTAGFNSLAITAFDAATSYTAIGTPGSPTLVTRVTADSSAVIAGAALPIQVRVFDRFGNGAAETAIQWTATGGSLTITNATTGANGGSATIFTTPTTPGTYNVTATLPGRSSVTFKIVAL